MKRERYKNFLSANYRSQSEMLTTRNRYEINNTEATSLKVLSEIMKAAKDNPGLIHNFYRKIFWANISSSISEPGEFINDPFPMMSDENKESDLTPLFEISKSSIGLIDRKTKYVRIYINNKDKQLYLEDDKVYSGSVGCICCLNGGHHPKKKFQDLTDQEVIKALFDRVDQISSYDNFLAWDILESGFIFSSYLFFLTLLPYIAAVMLACRTDHEKIVMCATSPIWGPLTVAFFCAALSIALPLYAAFMTLAVASLALEIFIAQPLKVLRKCYEEPSKTENVWTFIQNLKNNADANITPPTHQSSNASSLFNSTQSNSKGENATQVPSANGPTTG